MDIDENETKDFRDLPEDVLCRIFRFLEPFRVNLCRKVCSSWWYAVQNNFSEQYWMEACALEFFDVCDESKKRSGLNWAELYNSLRLWSKVDEAKVKVYKIPMKKTTQYIVLPDKTIGCAHRLKPKTPLGKYDTIVYYDLVTLCESRRRSVEVRFRNYFENQFFTLVDYDTKRKKSFIRIYSKVPHAQYHDVQIAFKSEWTVVHRHIYYQTDGTDGKTKVFTSTEVTRFENNVIYDDKPIIQQFDGIIEGVVKTTHKLHIFTSGDQLRVQIINQKKEIERTSFTTNNLIDGLSSYGFNWTTPNIFDCIYPICTYDKRIAVHDVYAPLIYNNMLLSATKKIPMDLKIFWQPNEPSGELILDKIQPKKVISLNDYLDIPSGNWHKNKLIAKLNVLEVRGGHKILALYDRRVVVIELYHSEDRACEPSPTHSAKYVMASDGGPSELSSLDSTPAHDWREPLSDQVMDFFNNIHLHYKLPEKPSVEIVYENEVPRRLVAAEMHNDEVLRHHEVDQGLYGPQNQEVVRVELNHPDDQELRVHRQPGNQEVIQIEINQHYNGEVDQIYQQPVNQEVEAEMPPPPPNNNEQVAVNQANLPEAEMHPPNNNEQVVVNQANLPDLVQMHRQPNNEIVVEMEDEPNNPDEEIGVLNRPDDYDDAFYDAFFN